MNCAVFPIKKCCDKIKQAHENGEIAIATDPDDIEATLVYRDEESKEKYSDTCIFCNKKLEIQKTKAYLIIGSTGEYENYTEWNVRAYLDKTFCFNYMNRLNKHLANSNVPLSNDQIAGIKPSSFIDFKLEENWHGFGVTYRIEEIEIYDTHGEWTI